MHLVDMQGKSEDMMRFVGTFQPSASNAELKAAQSTDQTTARVQEEPAMQSMLSALQNSCQKPNGTAYSVMGSWQSMPIILQTS